MTNFFICQHNMLHCYRCRPPASSPVAYPVLLFIALASIFIALSKVLSFQVEVPEYHINWGLLLVPILILVLVRWLTPMEKPYRYHSPCGRCGKAHYCYCR